MSARDIQTKRKTAEPLPKERLKLVKELFAVKATSNEFRMARFIVNYVEQLGLTWDMDNSGNIYVTKGKGTYPTYLSHIDTVHTYPSGYNIVVSEGKVYAFDDKTNQVGCGGDDKCGIFVCLMLLETLENVKVVFCSQEESGCQGSMEADISFFNDSTFLCGIDRWGNSDVVTNYAGDTTVSKNFLSDIQPFMNKYGYTQNSGMMTDVFIIQEGVQLSCINLSCGYYQHHTSAEWVDIDEMWKAYLFCVSIASLKKTYKHKISHRYSGFNNNGFSSKNFKLRKCPHCNEEIYSEHFCSFCKSYIYERDWKEQKAKDLEEYVIDAWSYDTCEKCGNEFYITNGMTVCCSECNYEMVNAEDYNFCEQCSCLYIGQTCLGCDDANY